MGFSNVRYLGPISACPAIPTGCWVLIVLALLVCAPAVHAQGGGENAPAEWIRPEEVPARADALLRQLEEVPPGAASQAALDRIEAGLAEMGPDLDAAIDRARATLARSALPGEIEDVLLELQDAAAPLAGWRGELEAEAQRVGKVLDEIAQAERRWSETSHRPETPAAGEVIERRVQTSLEALAETGARLRTWRTRVLAASDRLVARNAAVQKAREELEAAAVAARANLFVPARPPLWKSGFGATLRGELPLAPQGLRAYTRNTFRYIGEDARPFAVQALLAVLLMAAFRTLAARARERLEGAETGSRGAWLLERPYAIGLLLALLATPAFHPLAPRQLNQLMALIAVFPAARIVIHASGRVDPITVSGLVVLLLSDRLGLAFASLPALARATFLSTLVIALGLAFRFKRRIHGMGEAPWLRRAVDVAMAGLIVALLADVGGWTTLGVLIGRGILAGAFAFLYIYAAALGLSAAVAYAMTSTTLRRSHLFDRRTAILQERAARWLFWLGTAVWFYFILIALGLRGVAAESLRALSTLGVSVGALSISVGDLLAFALTILTAMLLARTLNAVLEEEVYPRARLPRGIPYALSTLVRYAVYSLGFLFALAAAGLEIGKLAIMLGGLGVGVGLGLQDLVKNFAAGITLLVERRVHVGDVVEMPSQAIFGRVISIGMRASVVRGWNGAEVVVSNSDLVTGPITNWTLSDRLCRIEVPVGVAYGTDPERVIALLLEAAKSIDRLLKDPAPQVLFKGFGDSSLDFLIRAWTDGGYEQMLPLASELSLAVHRSLRDAGIAIPFPQRDLHLASVSPDARAALSGVAAKDSDETRS